MHFIHHLNLKENSAKVPQGLKFEPASWVRRIAAYLIDIAVLISVSLVIIILLMPNLIQGWASMIGADAYIGAWVMFTFTVNAGMYLFFFLWAIMEGYWDNLLEK